MTIYGWDAVSGNVAMPAAGETVNSAPFSVPRQAISLAVHTPTSLVASATLKIQSLDHDSNVGSEVWRDVQLFNVNDGTFVALDGIPQNLVTTIPIAATGGGVLRFVATADQSSVPTTIKVDFV